MKAGRVSGLLVVLLLAGCTGGPQPSTSDTATPTPTATVATATPTATASGSALAELAVGDCTTALDASAGSLVRVPTTACTTSHDWEVAGVTTLTAEEYPGATVLSQQAATQCPTDFTSYLGTQPQYSRYSTTYLAPSKSHWSDPANRRLVCLVGSSAGGLTTSIKGDSSLFPTLHQCTGRLTGDPRSIKVVDCSTKHNYEVYAAKVWTGKKAPTTKQFDSLYNKTCVAGFKKFVGRSPGSSTYEISYLMVTAKLWKQIPDHRLVCTAGSPKGGITGSLKGVKK